MSTEPRSQDNDSQYRKRTRADRETENEEIDRDFRSFMIPLAGGAVFIGLGLGFLLNPSGDWHVDLTKLLWLAASIAGGVGGYQWHQRLIRKQ